MGSNVKIGTGYINGTSMAGTVTGSWIDSFESQRFSFSIFWTGSPTGTLYIDVADGAYPGAAPQINSLINLTTPVVATSDYLSSIVVTSGLTTDSVAYWLVSGGNDFNYIRVRWVPTGTTSGNIYVTGCLKAYK